MSVRLAVAFLAEGTGLLHSHPSKTAERVTRLEESPLLLAWKLSRYWSVAETYLLQSPEVTGVGRTSRTVEQGRAWRNGSTLDERNGLFSPTDIRYRMGKIASKCRAVGGESQRNRGHERPSLCINAIPAAWRPLVCAEKTRSSILGRSPSACQISTTPNCQSLTA